MVQTYKSRLFFLVFSLNLFLPALLHRSQRDTGNTWLQYINSLTAAIDVREAAIYGIEDGLLYASSPGLANITGGICHREAVAQWVVLPLGNRRVAGRLEPLPRCP
ncbi:uncharacterized protein LOC143012583 isoform X2 [Genypterus blacodes]|uniref:uncharacterized protein LOC143012583 isoform X2 n=1 Tax=Genypterus blacodes TaxID=154954 RepID=UPI003F75FA63